MRKYRYKGEKYELNKFQPGQGKQRADELAKSLPFECKTDGSLTEKDIQFAEAVKTGMKDQVQRWTSYANNMTEAVDDVPEVVEQQNRVRGAVLDAATKVVQSTAKLDEKGATHQVEVTKTYQQITGNVANILLKGRLAIKYLTQAQKHTATEFQTRFSLDSQLANHKHQVNQSNARASFRERLAAVRQGKATYTLRPGDIDL